MPASVQFQTPLTAGIVNNTHARPRTSSERALTTWDTVSSTFAADQSEHFNNLFRPKEPLILYKSDFQLYSHEYLSIL
jgi:hypothetical protein